MIDLKKHRIQKTRDGTNYVLYRKVVSKDGGKWSWGDPRYYPNPEMLAKGLLRDVIKGPTAGNLEAQVRELNDNVLTAYEDLGRQLRGVMNG